jgi:hypothetical protein
MPEPIQSLCFACTQYQPELFTADQIIANCDAGRETSNRKVFCAAFAPKPGYAEPQLKLTQ